MDYAVNIDPEMLATMTAQQAPMPVAQAPAQQAPQLSAAAQSFLDRVDAYEQQKRDEGYLVRRNPLATDDLNASYEALAAQLDKGLSPADLQVTALGHAFRTNKDKPAKTKANPTGEIYAAPGTKYRLTNEQGKDAILVEGEGQTALDQIYNLSKGLSETEKKKADWKVEVYEPGPNKWRPLADDDPPGDIIGKLAKIGLPIAGALLAGPLGLGGALGIGGVGAAAAGAALGSVAGGAIAGDSIGDILKGAALSGGLTFAGGSALGGLGGGGGATANLAGSSLGSGLANSAAGAVGGALGAGASGASNVAGNAAGNAAAQGTLGAAGEIVVNGVRQLPTAISGAAGALGSAGANAASQWATNQPPADATTPKEIVVSKAKPPPPLDPGSLASGIGPLVMGPDGVTYDPNTIEVQKAKPVETNTPPVVIPPVTVNTPPELLEPKKAVDAQNSGDGNPTLSDIVDYLQAAGLLSGFLGDLLGGGGGGGRAKIPAGWGPSGLGGVFTKPLPTASLPGVNGRTTRLMPPQDWTKYAMRPEQSFWSNVAKTYTPPPPGQYDLWSN